MSSLDSHAAWRSIPNKERLSYHIGIKQKCLKVSSHLDVLQLDFEEPFMVCMLLCQVHSMGKVTCLTEHLDCCLHIKVDLTLTGLQGGNDGALLGGEGER